jgi:hypothetical protein
MALIQITTTVGAIDTDNRQALARSLAKLVYTAEGFGDSKLAPHLTWATFEELPTLSMLPGTGTHAAPLYYVRITSLAHAISAPIRQQLGADLMQVLLSAEGVTLTPDNASRVWVQFIDVADGDLVVGGHATSLQGLRSLVAQAA